MSDSLNPEPSEGIQPDLKAIRERCELATPEPWQVAPDSTGGGIHTQWFHGQLGGPVPVATVAHTIEKDKPAHYCYILPEDAEFIAHARTDIPAMLDYIASLESRCEKLEGENKLLRKEVQRQALNPEPRCERCGQADRECIESNCVVRPVPSTALNPEPSNEWVHTTNAGQFLVGKVFGWRDVRSETGWLSGIVVKVDHLSLRVLVTDLRAVVIKYD